MSYALFGIGIFIIGLWFVKGIMNTRKHELDKTLEAYEQIMENNRKADELLDDPDYKQRLYDDDNS